MVGRGICVSLGTDAGNNSNLFETLRSMGNARASSLRRDGPWCDGTYGLPLFFSASFPS